MVVLDKICDPRNLGAIIGLLTARAHGIVIPKETSGGDAGGEGLGRCGRYIPIAQVTNTVRAIDQLKGMGL